MIMTVHVKAGRLYNAKVPVGSRSSVVRTPAAQAGGPVFDPRRLPCLFFFLFQLDY